MPPQYNLTHVLDFIMPLQYNLTHVLDYIHTLII